MYYPHWCILKHNVQTYFFKTDIELLDFQKRALPGDIVAKEVWKAGLNGPWVKKGTFDSRNYWLEACSL